MRIKLANNKILKETGWSILAKAVTFVFFIGLNIFLARYLGPEDFGRWTFFYSTLNIVLLVSHFGINASAKKYLAQFNQTDKLGSILRSSLKIRIIYSILFVLVFLYISGPLAEGLKRPDFARLFILALPLIFFSGLVEFFKHAFEGLHRLKYAFYVTLSEHGLKLLITLTILLVANNLAAIVHSFTLALAAASLTGFLIYYYLFYKRNRIGRESFETDIIKYSIPLFLVSAGFAIVLELDVVMMGILSVDKEVGIYSVAKQIVVKLPHLAFAIALGSMPVFARLNAGNKEELKRLLNRLLLVNTIIFGLISLLILTASSFFIPMIFGEEYRASVTPLMILVPYLILVSYSVFFSSFLDYQGKAAKRALNLAITILLNVLLNIILIPAYGAAGAAMGTSVSFIPYLFLNWWEVKKILRSFD